MCTSPVFIVNPYYIKHVNEYPLVYLNGKTVGYQKNFWESFNFKYINPYRYGVNSDNLSQFYAYNVSGECIDLFIAVPCGKCDTCIQSKINNISSRALLEHYGSEQASYFVTLTYDDEHLPLDGVNVRDLQLFFKRLRINYKRKCGKDLNLRYVFFSEYGSNFHRPHYHGILFGCEQSDSVSFFKFLDIIKSSWKNGFIHCKLTHQNSFRYIAKYVTKGSNVPFGKNENFYVASRLHGGLGCSALRNKEFVLKMLRSTNGKVRLCIDGKIRDIFVPKQVRNYFFKECLEKYEAIYKKDVYNLIHNSLKLNILCYKYDLDPEVLLTQYGEFDSFSSSKKMRDAIFDVCTSVVPKFLYEQFPMFGYLYKSLSLPDYRINYYYKYDIDNICKSIVYLCEKLLNVHLDLNLLSENSLILQKLKNYILYDSRRFREFIDDSFSNCLYRRTHSIDKNRESLDLQ